MNRNVEKVFHLSIIIDNPISIIHSMELAMEFEPKPYLHYDSLFLSHWISFLFQHIDLRRAFFLFFLFLYLYHEFCTFSHLGFTYTTYTAVKGNFLLVSYFDSKGGKK